MKNLLVLMFYLAGFTGALHNFYENLPPHQWFFTTRMRRPEPIHLTVIPRPTPRLDLSKFIYWKHLLELECFKELCSKNQLKDRSVHKRPFQMIGQRQMPAFRNDETDYHDHIPSFYKGRENQLAPETKRKYSPHERIILWPPERNFTAKHPNVSPIKKEFSSNKTLEVESEKSGPRKSTTQPNQEPQQKIDCRLPYPFPSCTTIRGDEADDSGAFLEGRPAEVEGISRRTGPDNILPELFLKPAVSRSSTITYPEDISYDFKYRVRPDRIKPYEVEEIIEEKFLVDVDEDEDENEKDEGKGKNVSGKDIRKYLVPESEGKKKVEHFRNIIDTSVHTILKGLINPVMEAEPSPVLGTVLPVEKAGKQSTVKPSNTTGAFTSHALFENIYNIPFQQQTSSRPNKIKPSDRYLGWRQQTPDPPQKLPKQLFKPDTRIDKSRGFDLNPSFQKEYFRSLLLTDSPKKPPATEAYDKPSPNIFSTDKFQSGLVEDFGEKPMLDTRITELSISDPLRSLDLLRNLMANHLPSFAPTEKISSTIQKIPPTHISETTPTFVSESSEELVPTTVDSKDIFTESNSALSTQDFLETVKYFSEATTGDVLETEHNFLEFSDHPMSFDLLTTTIQLDSKKDEETSWKTSRRTTASTKTSGVSQTEQRRSDILITDNLADYVDDENNFSTLSYFEKLKQNNSLFPPDPSNLTSDALIPFIPVVINDLREGRIPPEDIPIFSHALGKYWNSILELANFTNLDMLPLIKMKDEKDLENVLQNFLPEVKTSTTVTRTTKSDHRIHEDYPQSYDYIDEYKDLYKDVLGQDLGDKKKRFRPRRDVEDDLKTLEATREYFDSIREEERDDGSEYIFEDIIYDEVSDGEDESVFELMEVSDVHIGKET